MQNFFKMNVMLKGPNKSRKLAKIMTSGGSDTVSANLCILRKRDHEDENRIEMDQHHILWTALTLLVFKPSYSVTDTGVSVCYFL
jgi:hypothetical protein